MPGPTRVSNSQHWRPLHTWGNENSAPLGESQGHEPVADQFEAPASDHFPGAKPNEVDGAKLWERIRAEQGTSGASLAEEKEKLKQLSTQRKNLEKQTKSFEEELLDHLLKIGARAEKQLIARMRAIESGSPGPSQFLGQTTSPNLLRTAGGLVGGIAGSVLSGGSPLGTSVGTDIGARLTDAATGGSDTSKQLELEKLKFEIQQYSQLISTISNILATTHKNAMNTIGNIRA